MTEQELEALRQMRHEDVQDENGIDVTQIDELLALTPTQRIQRLEEFMASFDGLQPGGNDSDGPNSGTTEQAA